MSEKPVRQYVLRLTIEVPDIYVDDFHQAAEDGFTGLDCLAESIDLEGVLVLTVHEGDGGGRMMQAYPCKLLYADAEPIGPGGRL